MDDSSKQVTVRDDGVEVERTIEDRSTATVVVYRLKALEAMPIIVHIEEAIPPDDRIKTLEFHPSHLPDDWTMGDGVVQFDATVPPDKTQMVIFGLDASEDEPLGHDEPAISRPDTGTATISETNGAAPAASDDNRPSPEDGSSVLDLGAKTVSDGGEATADPDSDEVLDLPDPNADDSETDIDDSETDIDDSKEGVEDSEPALDADDDVDESSAEIGAALSSDDSGESVDTADFGETTNIEESADTADTVETVDSENTADFGDSTNNGDSADSEETTNTEDATSVSGDDLGPAKADDDAQSTDAVAPEDIIEDADESPESVTGPEPAVGIEDAEDAGDADPATDEPIGDDRGAAGESAADLGLDDGSEMDTAPAAAGDSLVGDLLTELRSGNASEEELDALRSELGVARADEVRFRHVQSRMDDFEAYVDALEEIINSHGTASEFVDGIERQVSDIHDELSSVRNEVHAVEDGLETADDDREELADEVAELDETVAEVTDDLTQLRELVETVDDRTSTVEEELREELEAVREEQAEELERIEADLEAEREQLEAEFEAELDSLRADVESFDEVRRTLLDAFGDGLEPSSADDDTAEQ